MRRGRSRQPAGSCVGKYHEALRSCGYDLDVFLLVAFIVAMHSEARDLDLIDVVRSHWEWNRGSDFVLGKEVSLNVPGRRALLMFGWLRRRLGDGSGDSGFCAAAW